MSKAKKKQTLLSEAETANHKQDIPLTVENFGSALEQALATEGVKATLHEALGPLIDMIVAEKIAKVEENFKIKMKELRKAHDKQVQGLNDEIHGLRVRQNDIEQYSKREDLIIKGLHIPQTYAQRASAPQVDDRPGPMHAVSPSLTETVVDFFDKDMGVQVPVSAISTAHPLPSRNGPPAVIVRFSSRDARNLVYSKRFALKGKRIFVDEHLTSENSKQMFNARKLKHDKKILDCFTRNCAPFVRLLDRRVVPFNNDLQNTLESD